ncbi:MAG: hypothetical protein J0H27_06435 [Xanthomonadales bacterium]|nr:hypothetical protein [Xanthomonadales bacterium]
MSGRGNDGRGMWHCADEDEVDEDDDELSLAEQDGYDSDDDAFEQAYDEVLKATENYGG